MKFFYRIFSNTALISWLLLSYHCLNAQHINSAPVFQSPNTASLGTYGAVDISPYTGLASIGVDVFFVKEGDITVNCRLNYFSGGVKPSTHPGWVGQNWNLNVGGVVSRKINGGVDEVTSSAYPNNENQFAYYNNYSYLNASNWSTAAYISGLYPNNSTVTTVVPNLAPDEFSFNLPNGTSGSFFLNHLGEWVVKTKSESDIKVTVQTNTENPSFPQPFQLVSRDENNQPLTINIKRIIYIIEITDNTGFKYTFGNNPNSIEFTRGPHSQVYANNEDVIANAWYLTKVESPAGNVVNFNYTRGVQGHQYHQNVDYPSSLGISINGGAKSYTQSLAVYSGHIITPVYLQSITASSFQIGFTMAESTELKYDYKQGVYAYPKFQFSDIQTQDQSPTNEDIYQVSKWYKLTAINITDPQGATKEKYAFEYNDQVTERLFLRKFKRLGLASSDNPITYEFLYNTATLLPGYNALQNDRWGYYNGKAFPTTISGSTEAQVLALLDMDETKAQAGILTGIIYPTGGRSDFFYQANDYTSVLQKTGSPASINLTAQSGIGGGLRIWKITNKDTDGHSYTTEYKYLKSSTNTSSGILAGNKIIHKQINISAPSVATIDAYDMNDYAELDYTNGRDVVYSEVKKILPDNSYVIYKYSNSDNSNYIDELPLNIYSDGYKATTSPYAYSATLPSSNSNPYPSHNSKELERGQLLSEERYNSTGTIVNKISYTYNTDANRYNEFVRSYDNYAVQAQAGSLLANERYFQAIKIYTYYPYLSGKTEVVYDQVNAIAQETTTDVYSYGLPSHKQRKLITTQNSKNEAVTESIIYNKDIVDGTPVAGLNATQLANLTSMYSNKKMIVPVQVTKSVGGVQTKQERYSFKTNYLLDYIENSTDSNPLEIRMNINNYDGKGNITEQQKSNDIKYAYLYEYNVPIAEIINADYASVAYTGFENGNGNWNVSGTTNTNYFTGKRSYSLSGGNITKSSLPVNSYRISFWGYNNPSVLVNGTAPIAGPTRNSWTYYEFTTGSVSAVTISGSGVIDELRLCPASARMTTYAYDPLVGYTAKVGTDNDVLYFEYDTFNRLKWMKDKDRNIVKAYDYNYQVR